MAKATKSGRTGRLAGMPYDWRKPTKKRFRQRLWNNKAPLVTPKAYGWGYDINFYRLLHLFKPKRK